MGSSSDIKSKMEYIIKNKKHVKNLGIMAKKNAVKYFDKNLITNQLLKFINSNINLK